MNGPSALTAGPSTPAVSSLVTIDPRSAFLPASASTAEAVSALNTHGFCVVPDVLSAAMIAKLTGHIENYMNGGWPRSLENPFHGLNTYRFFDLLNADREWTELPVLPKVLDVGKAVLGKDCLLTTYGTWVFGLGGDSLTIRSCL
jgi:hypothetical protein